MAEQYDEIDLNITVSKENTYNLKKELEDNNFLDISSYVCEPDNEVKNCDTDIETERYGTSTLDTIKTELSKIQSNMLKDDIKIEDEINDADIKIESNNELLYCDQCREEYEDYCMKCGGMLVHILNAVDRAQVDIPRDILEIRESGGYIGIFALKGIPRGVRFGPFNGLDTSKHFWRLRAGRFMASKDKSKFLNWMQYVNFTRNISEQNLYVFQCEHKLYYCSVCEIQEDEELLVYLGGEYEEDSLHKDVEIAFTPPVERGVIDVFACTFCCLGFGSRVYLAKHKSICFKGAGRKFSIEDISNCQFCGIYMDEKEYLEFHMTYCSERHERKPIPLALEGHSIQVKKCKVQQYQLYKCIQCTYKTKYKTELNRHANQHYKVKMYKCRNCSRRFKIKEHLKMHLKKIHVDLKRKKRHLPQTKLTTVFKCPVCQLQIKKKYLKNHIKTKHLKEFNYKCLLCDLKTSQKSRIKIHIKTKHLKEFKYNSLSSECKTDTKDSLKRQRVKLQKCSTTNYSETNIPMYSQDMIKQFKCTHCEYQTKKKYCINRHIKAKHLQEYKYECTSCQYRTSNKSDLNKHTKTNHLKEFDYNCDKCDYKTNKKSNLEAHIKTKHLKEYNYVCEICQYKTNQKTLLNRHVQTKHLKEFDYKCALCEYKTNYRPYLNKHFKNKHSTEFNYRCTTCDYKTNSQSHLEQHIKTKHLAEFSHECGLCQYKTNWKSNLRVHMKLTHLREYKLKCEFCEFRTDRKSYLEHHVKTSHLKEFSYKCEKCNYKTNNKWHLERHMKAVHLRIFDYKCEFCEYQTNIKKKLDNHVKVKHPDGRKYM